MKIVLLIAVCKQNRQRIQNQINNLKQSTIPSGVELKPVFVFAKDGKELDVNIPYDVITVDSEERYNLLYKKLFAAYKTIHQSYDYDFIWKIDDDTKINLERFHLEIIEGFDYVGRIFSGQDTLSITLNFGFHNIYKTIDFAPPFCKEFPHEFASGDCYFLSKRAVQCILSAEQTVQSYEGIHICEDRLFGYLLHDKGLRTKDIKVLTDPINEHCLQVTKNLLSIHPIHESVYPKLIGKSPEEQLTTVYENRILNLVRRKAYITELENKLKDVIVEFLNSNKSMGMG